MYPGVGHRVAPLQSLPVEIGVVGEAHAGPHIAPDVFHSAFDLSLRLRPVGTAQPDVKAQTPGEVQHPEVPLHPALLVLAQGDHLGVVVEAAAGHAAQVLEGVDVALDEGGSVRPAHQLHVAGPRPAHGHHEGPDPVLLPVSADVPQAAPVHLGLLSRRRLEAHGGLGLTGPAAMLHVVGQGGVASAVAQGPQLPQQHHAVLQPLFHPAVNVPGIWVQLRAP